MLRSLDRVLCSDLYDRVKLEHGSVSTTQLDYILNSEHAPQNKIFLAHVLAVKKWTQGEADSHLLQPTQSSVLGAFSSSMRFFAFGVKLRAFVCGLRFNGGLPRSQTLCRLPVANTIIRNDDEPSDTKQRRVLTEIIMFMMFAFICFVPITYGREACILMELPQSDCCYSQDIGCDDLYNMAECEAGRMIRIWRAVDTITADSGFGNQVFSLTFDLIRESKSILTFACNDDNYLSTMVGSQSFASWQGSHTPIVLAIVVGIWTNLSVAPKDVHENYIQFGLERDVPVTAAVFATHHEAFYVDRKFRLAPSHEPSYRASKGTNCMSPKTIVIEVSQLEFSFECHSRILQHSEKYLLLSCQLRTS
ncbi:probable methyltransferase PMT11 [Tanacetum coccineum]